MSKGKRQDLIEQIVMSMGFIQRKMLQGRQARDSGEAFSEVWRRREEEMFSLPDQEPPTPAQIRVLMGVIKLFMANKRGPTIKELAALLGVSSSAVTQIVDTLVARDLLQRKPDASDRRSIALRLSQRMHDRLHEIRAVSVAQVSDIFDALSQEELSEYCRLNKKIMESLLIQPPEQTQEKES